MGGERIRTWKYLYFCIAGLIFPLFLSCATLQEMEKGRDARQHFVRGGDLLANGDYEGSLRENREAFSLAGRNTPGDDALFNMALIYAHYEYPKRDYKKSLDLFRRLEKVYPRSPLVVKAKIWIGMLQENEKLTDEIQGLTDEIQGLNNTLKKTKQENERLSSEIGKLNKTIEKTKQVDIEIEEKKKELSK